MGPRSPLRSGRRRADIPWMSCAPSSAWLRLLWGRCPWFKVSPPARSLQNRRPPGRLATRLPQGFGYCVAGAPWVQGLRSASVGAEQTSPGCLAVFAPLRSAQSRHPPDVLRPIFRKASVVAEQAPMVQGLASGSVVAEQTSPPRTSCNPYSARLRLLRGRHQWGQGLAFALYLPR